MRVALPIALQSLIGSSLNLVDNIMVGRLGETEVAAVGVGILPFILFWMVLFGFNSGSAAFISQFFGARDGKNIKKTLGFAICVSACIGILFFSIGRFFPELFVNIITNNDALKPLATEYIKVGSFCFLFLGFTVPFTFCLRATQQTRLPLYISAFAFCVNTFLNYVLIFGNFGAPRLGVMGSALATVIARALELTLVLTIVFFGKNMIAGKPLEYFGWAREFASRVVGIALPTMLNETVWGAGSALYTVAYARMATTEFAAFQASRVIENLFIMAAFSIGDAALILIGQRLGAGELDYGFALAKKMLKITAVMGLCFGALMIAASKPIIGFYNFSGEGQKYAFYILVIYGSLMFVFLINSLIVVGILRAGGDTKAAMAIDCSTVWVIGVPTAFITTQFLRLPIYFCVLLVSMEEAVKLSLLIRRFRSRKWVKNVITNL